MTTTTARVDVLTAEVRVLMVGSRQVTLSVYAQLDQVEFDEIEPFGRIAPRDAARGCLYVVGASIRNADRGTLVRAVSSGVGTLRHHAERARRLAAITGRYDSAMVQLERIGDGDRDPQRWRELNDQARESRWELEREGVDHWSYDELTEEAQQNEDRAETATRWSELPLIVLAGLR